MRRWSDARVLMAGAALALAACAGADGSPRPPSQAQQLCASWGYDPNDPACLRTFRRDAP